MFNSRNQHTHPPSRPVVPDPVLVDATRVSTDVGELWLPARDEVLLPYMQRAGKWEPSEAKLLRSLLERDSRFLDVGANVGYFSALAARSAPDGTIDAVEPEPGNLALLRLNLWALAPHAQIWPVGLGETRSIAALHSSEHNPGDTVLEMKGGQAHALAAVVRGDEIFAGRTFDVVKVDVQGFETDVVKGMAGVWAGSPNVRIVAEFFPGAISRRGHRPEDALRFYADAGFKKLADVDGKLLPLADSDVLSLCARAGSAGYVNLLLTRN